MICNACRNKQHWLCFDAKPGTPPKHDGKRYVVPMRTDRDYPSCHCQHVCAVAPEPATGPAGE